MLGMIPAYASKIELFILASIIVLLIFFKTNLMNLLSRTPEFVLIFSFVILIFVTSIYYRIRFAGLEVFRYQLTLITLMLLTAILLFLSNKSFLKIVPIDFRIPFHNSKKIVIVLLSCTYIYSFGSSDGYFHKFSEFTAFFFLIILILVAKANISLFSKSSLLTLISILTILSNIIVLSSNFEKQSFETAQHSIQFGKNKNNKIFVKFEQKNRLDYLRLAVVNEGFVNSTPLINLASPGYSYFLGGNVPNSIHPTFFNRENSIKLLEYNIHHQNKKFSYEKAWIIQFNESSPLDYSNFQTEKAKEILEKSTNIDKISDYKVIYSDNDIQVLKPIDAS
jgi:hypothetical protein